MPITYQRDDRRRRIIVTTIGIVGLDDMLAPEIGDAERWPRESGRARRVSRHKGERSADRSISD
jgi:hypothetical protein